MYGRDREPMPGCCLIAAIFAVAVATGLIGTLLIGGISLIVRLI